VSEGLNFKNDPPGFYFSTKKKKKLSHFMGFMLPRDLLSLKCHAFFSFLKPHYHLFWEAIDYFKMKSKVDFLKAAFFKCPHLT